MHHQRAAFAPTVTASMGQPSGGTNARLARRGSAAQPEISATCSVIITGKWPNPYSTPPRPSRALACRAETTSSATRSQAMTLRSTQ